MRAARRAGLARPVSPQCGGSTGMQETPSCLSAMPGSKDRQNGAPSCLSAVPGSKALRESPSCLAAVSGRTALGETPSCLTAMSGRAGLESDAYPSCLHFRTAESPALSPRNAGAREPASEVSGRRRKQLKESRSCLSAASGRTTLEETPSCLSAVSGRAGLESRTNPSHLPLRNVGALG